MLIDDGLQTFPSLQTARDNTAPLADMPVRSASTKSAEVKFDLDKFAERRFAAEKSI